MLYSLYQSVCSGKKFLKTVKVTVVGKIVSGKAKVVCFTQLNDMEYEGFVNGSMREPYKVHINLNKVRSSTCNCPFATGSKICKHMVAVYFAAFPDEARKYKIELDAYYEEEEEREAELEDALHKYIKKLSKAELQEALLQLLHDGHSWQFDRFINEYIEWE